MGNIKRHGLNIAQQTGKLMHLFPGACLTTRPNGFTWKHTLTPSPLSALYDIKLSYSLNDHPNVYVVNTTLQLYPGEDSLPHVYNHEKQWLCLYHRKGGEWNSSMLIADTVVPWTCEWLLHYECWLITGKWQGGGIHHNKK